MNEVFREKNVDNFAIDNLFDHRAFNECSLRQTKPVLRSRWKNLLSC